MELNKNMTKQDAIDLFSNVKTLAETLRVSRQAIYQWPDVLDTTKQDLVVGAAVRIGLIKAPQIKKYRA